MKKPVALPSFAAFALLSGALLSGCAGPAAPVDVSAACASVSVSTTPPTCERAYDTGVAVRLPETDTGAVGAVARGGEEFVTSTGTRLAMSDSARDRVLVDNAYASSIYQAQVSDGTVTSLTPVLTVPSGVVLTRALGGAVLVGEITPYAGDDVYDTAGSLPVVVTLDAAATGDLLRGTIANATSAVALSDGTCVPALTAAGSRNPLQGTFASSLQLSRDPSMHTAFDDELVLHWADSSSGMGAGFFPSVATLMDADPLTATWEVSQHGNPVSGPGLVVQRSSATVDTGRACS
ncbi:hypothetical protein QE411_002431 [Microbacterium arborescens]|nr:hypothetical protein [Microbacterium arborescens]